MNALQQINTETYKAILIPSPFKTVPFVDQSSCNLA